MAHRGKMELLSRDLLIAAGEVPADCPITGPGGCKYETRLLRWMEKQRGADGGFPGGADGVLARAFDVLTRSNERDTERKQALAANVAGGKKKGKKKSVDWPLHLVCNAPCAPERGATVRAASGCSKKHNDKHAGGSSGQSRGFLPPRVAQRTPCMQMEQALPGIIPSPRRPSPRHSPR